MAKAANLVAVKVLNAAGSGSNSDIIDGLNWYVMGVQWRLRVRCLM